MFIPPNYELSNFPPLTRAQRRCPMAEPIKRNLSEQLAWLSQNRAAAVAFAPPTPGAAAPALATAAFGPSSMAPDVALTATISKIRASEPMKWALAPGRSPAELFARFDPVPKLPPAQAPPPKPERTAMAAAPAALAAVPAVTRTRVSLSAATAPRLLGCYETGGDSSGGASCGLSIGWGAE